MEEKTYEIYVDNERYAREYDRSRAAAIFRVLDDYVAPELDGKKKQLMEVWDTDKYAYPGKVLKEDIIHVPGLHQDIEDDIEEEIEEEQPIRRGFRR